jgi:hypothetical protein
MEFCADGSEGDAGAGATTRVHTEPGEGGARLHDRHLVQPSAECHADARHVDIVDAEHIQGKMQTTMTISGKTTHIVMHSTGHL